jgi:two-component system sensor histidine kinase EvgS
VRTFSDAIDAVIENRADLLYDTYAALSYALKKEGISSIIPFKSSREHSNNVIHIITRKNAPELAQIIQKGLNAISAEEKQTIYDKWLGTIPKELQTLKLTIAEQQWLIKHPTIRFTGDPNWLPYEAFDQQGNYIGIVAEYLKIIEQKLGIKLTIIPTKTWVESINKVKQGKIDILSETNDSDLKSHLSFTKPYIASPVVIIMNKDTNYVDNIEQIKHKKIAIIKEYGYVPKIIAQYPEIDFIIVNSIQEGLTAVSTGKVEALLATLAQSSYHISELGINNIRSSRFKYNCSLPSLADVYIQAVSHTVDRPLSQFLRF